MTNQSGTETFNVLSLFAAEGGDNLQANVRQFIVSSDSRAGSLIPMTNSILTETGASGGALLNAQGARENARKNRAGAIPMLITSPEAQLHFFSTASDNATVSVIWQWVEHPFPAQIKAYLLGQLLGEIRQVQVQRSAGSEYFQVPRYVQIGGIPAP